MFEPEIVSWLNQSQGNTMAQQWCQLNENIGTYRVKYITS